MVTLILPSNLDQWFSVFVNLNILICYCRPQVTIATAIIFCHRFYVCQSHAKNDRRVSIINLEWLQPILLSSCLWYVSDLALYFLAEVNGIASFWLVQCRLFIYLFPLCLVEDIYFHAWEGKLRSEKILQFTFFFAA